MESKRQIDLEAYLERISVFRGAEFGPTAETLRLLQKQHLLRVPFENLDIHWNRPIVLDVERFFQKIVVEERGGFCYELNGLFNELLRSLGFRTRIVSARVADGSGNFTPEYDHAALIVTIGELEYLADVGFGAFSAEPLRLVADLEQDDSTGVYSIRRFDDGYLEGARKEDGDWKSEYIFKPFGKDFSEFTERCDFQQYSPDSHFRKGKLCSLMTEDGRKTLTDKSFVVTENGQRHEAPVESETLFNELLLREFGITGGNPTDREGVP